MNLVVKNLPSSYNSHFLEMLFKKFGTVKSARVIYDRVTKEPLGMGFVDFQNEKDGLAAIEKLNGFEMEGKVLIVEKAKPKKVNIWS